MSGSGRIYALVALRDKVGSNAAVRTAVTKVLHDRWSANLGEWRTTARAWMAAGEDSLLKIQHDDELRAPAASVEVWYTSDDWFRDFAEHAVELAFAWSRCEFEVALARLGLGIGPAAWPSVDARSPEVASCCTTASWAGSRSATIACGGGTWTARGPCRHSTRCCPRCASAARGSLTANARCARASPTICGRSCDRATATAPHQ